MTISLVVEVVRKTHGNWNYLRLVKMLVFNSASQLATNASQNALVSVKTASGGNTKQTFAYSSFNELQF